VYQFIKELKRMGQDEDGQQAATLPGQLKRRRHGAKMMRLNLSLPQGLIDMVDEAAAKDFTGRSDIIRMAVLWYLRPRGRELDQTDPDVILKTLEHRKARAGMKRTMEELGELDVYDS